MTSAQLGLQLRDVAIERVAEARRLARKMTIEPGLRVGSPTRRRVRAH